MERQPTKAIVLLSGGVDSCVTLAHAIDTGKDCTALTFHYQQRHVLELKAAQAIARHYQVPHIMIHIDPTLFIRATHSSLTNPNTPLESGTHVPGRNLLFLAHAASLLESMAASEIYFGAHAQDSPAYPDCRPEFFSALERTICTGSLCGQVHIKTPLIDMDKAAVVRLGLSLSAPLGQTWSCYDPREGDLPCQRCPACLLRAQAHCPPPQIRNVEVENTDAHRSTDTCGGCMRQSSTATWAAPLAPSETRATAPGAG